MTLGRPRQYDISPERIAPFAREKLSARDMARQFGIPVSCMRDQLLRAGFRFDWHGGIWKPRRDKILQASKDTGAVGKQLESQR